MKKRLSQIALCAVLICAPIAFSGMTCKPSTQQSAYKTLTALETAVVTANAAFLDAVVTGRAPTNNVPAVESVFNTTQIAIRTAAATASAGMNATPPAATVAKANEFIGIAQANTVRK